jgi:hypothetical protein
MPKEEKIREKYQSGVGMDTRPAPVARAHYVPPNRGGRAPTSRSLKTNTSCGYHCPVVVAVQKCSFPFGTCYGLIPVLVLFATRVRRHIVYAIFL